MKNPNSYGNISKLSGNRRKPWRVRITKGWVYVNELGEQITNPTQEQLISGEVKQKQVYSTLGCYATRTEAIKVLAEYNDDPYDLERSNLTFADVYDKWSDEHFNNIVPSAVRTWKSAYSYCTPLYGMRFKDIKTYHLEQTIKNAKVGDNTKGRMKSLFNLMYRWAIKHEITNTDYAALCDSVKKPKAQIVRVPFSDDEIQTLWDNVDFPFVDMILIGIYTGFRPQELAILKVTDVDINDWIIKGGLKTDAGRNRIVPVHPKIKGIVKDNYKKALNIGSDTLFNDENGQQGTNLTYDKYRGRFTKVMKRFNMEHRPHDTRHTFITLAKRYEVNEYVLKLIAGHAIQDVTESVYTHRTIDDMRAEIEKIQ